MHETGTSNTGIVTKMGLAEIEIRRFLVPVTQRRSRDLEHALALSEDGENE